MPTILIAVHNENKCLYATTCLVSPGSLGASRTTAPVAVTVDTARIPTITKWKHTLPTLRLRGTLKMHVVLKATHTRLANARGKNASEIVERCGYHTQLRSDFTKTLRNWTCKLIQI